MMHQGDDQALFDPPSGAGTFLRRREHAGAGTRAGYRPGPTLGAVARPGMDQTGILGGGGGNVSSRVSSAHQLWRAGVLRGAGHMRERRHRRYAVLRTAPQPRAYLCLTLACARHRLLFTAFASWVTTWMTAAGRSRAAASLAHGPASGVAAWALLSSRAAERAHRERWLVRLRSQVARRTQRAALRRWHANTGAAAAAAAVRWHRGGPSTPRPHGLGAWLSRRGLGHLSPGFARRLKAAGIAEAEWLRVLRRCVLSRVLVSAPPLRRHQRRSAPLPRLAARMHAHAPPYHLADSGWGVAAVQHDVGGAGPGGSGSGQPRC